MVMLAACGRSDLSVSHGSGFEPPALAGAAAVIGGSAGSVSGATSGEPPVAGQAGHGNQAGHGGGAAHGGWPGESGAGGGAGETPALKLHDLSDYQVVQRALGGHSQRVEVSGRFHGSMIAAVQAQVVRFDSDLKQIVPWTELATSGTAYAGALEVPEGGWYRTLVRALDASGREVVRGVGAHRWGVGINVLCIGQSNMVGHGGDVYTTAGELAGLYSNDRAWKHLADPYDGGGSPTDVDFDYRSGASLVPSLVNALGGYFPGVPIGVIPAAKGSSPLVGAGEEAHWARRNSDNPADPSTLYGSSLTKARQAGGVELIVMHQGETDATNSTSRERYATELARLAQNYRDDLGNVPLFACQLGRSTTAISLKNRTDSTMQAIRAAQLDADDPPRLYLAATAIDLEVDATDHYVKSTLDDLGRRLAATIAYHYGVPGAPPAYRGPEIVSAAYADASRTLIDVTLRHRAGGDFTPAQGIQGFTVLDADAPVELASVSRKDATTIRISLAAASSGTVSVRYLYGKLPFQTLAATVHDDSPLALPLEPTVDALVLAP